MRWATGAHPQEAARVILCFLSLHFLMISYYLIKPLRNSQFLKEFDPDFLPVVSFGVVALSFVVTKIFSFLADRWEKYRLVTWTYLLIMVCKLLFAWLLVGGGKSAVVAFYFFASVYFLLAIATMWACANDIFTPDQGERCYGFIAVGSSLGSIVGSWLSKALSESSLRDFAPVFSALSMGAALLLVLAAARRRRRERAEVPRDHQAGPPAGGQFWNDVAEVLRRPYVRRIAVMVVVLAMYNTSLDYVSNRAIDRGVSRQQFARLFSYLPEPEYPVIYELKQKPEEQRAGQLASLAARSGIPLARLQADYRQYQQDSEMQARSLFSDVYRFQGIFGILMLLLAARVIFVRFGVRFATVILPLLAAVSTVAFSFALGLFAVQVIMVVVGAANYSLNNAAKEILYTASDEETKFKYKPLIEGPGMRLGDVLAAVLALAIGHLARVVGWNEDQGQVLLLAVLLIAVAAWLRAAYLAGQEYDKERRAPLP